MIDMTITKPPHYCRHCDTQLYRVEVYNTGIKKPMGHIWVCDECDERTVGYGDPDEYDGKPKGKP